MNRLALTSTTCSFLVVLGVSALPASAVTLSSLTANPNNTFKDLVGNVYDQFFFLPNQIGPNLIPVTADNVDIGSAPVSLGGSGIVITGAFTAQTGQINDFRLDYRVTTPAGLGINSLTLSAAANVTSTGTVAINENLFSPGSNTPIGGAQITFQSSKPAFQSSTASIDPPTSPIFVQKDVSLSVLPNDPSGFAGISIIDQLSTTTTTPSFPVPEPSEVLGTLALGALGVGSYLRSLQIKKQNR